MVEGKYHCQDASRVEVVNEHERRCQPTSLQAHYRRCSLAHTWWITSQDGLHEGEGCAGWSFRLWYITLQWLDVWRVESMAPGFNIEGLVWFIAISWGVKGFDVNGIRQDWWCKRGAQEFAPRSGETPSQWWCPRSAEKCWVLESLGIVWWLQCCSVSSDGE